MSAGYQNLFLEQGSTFTQQLTLQDAYGNPYNLTGFQVASQGRRSYNSANVSITFTSTIVNANTGVIQLSANSATTANLTGGTLGTLVYDVILADNSGNISRVLEGRVFVDPGVTNISLV